MTPKVDSRMLLLPILWIAVAHVASAQQYRTAEVNLTLGGDQGTGPEYQFERIDGLAFGKSGRILVADSKANTVRVFDSRGRFEYAIGRSGQGPGDLNRPCCITVAGETLWVEEGGNQRYSAFSLGLKSSRFLRSIRAPNAMSGANHRVSWDKSGNLIHLSDVFDSKNRSFRLTRTVLDSVGGTLRLDTLPEPPAEDLAVKQITLPVRGEKGGKFASTVGIAQPFGAFALRAFGPAGDVAEAVSSTYAITWTQNGRRLPIRSSLLPVRVSDRERAEAEQSLGEFLKRNQLSRSDLPFGIPEVKAPLIGLGFDLDGRLWVDRSVGDGQAKTADVYDRNGKHAMVVEWPRNIRLSLRASTGVTALGVAVDSLGVESVVRVQLVAKSKP
ncbi:MAG: 6-bladed beta-propeller [Gemmatimonadales bacterium]